MTGRYWPTRSRSISWTVRHVRQSLAISFLASWLLAEVSSSMLTVVSTGVAQLGSNSTRTGYEVFPPCFLKLGERVVQPHIHSRQIVRSNVGGSRKL